MDLKSKIILFAVFVSISASVGVMFAEYVTNDDFEIFRTEDGMPEQLEE